MNSASILKAGQYLGLFKFFRERNHLDQFMDGHLYCNTPEYYRLSAAKGVGDRNESCLISFRAARGDSPLEVEVEGNPVGKATDFITRIGRKDGWLHCWASFLLPENDVQFEQLKSDFERIQKEFGPYYAYVTPENSYEFLKRIQSLSLSVEAKPISYYRGGYYGTSVFHKAEQYSYQREFRILIGECETEERVRRSFQIQGGLRDIVQDCPKFELVGDTDHGTMKLCISLP